MDFLNSIQPFWIVLCCGALCAVGAFVVIVLPILGGALDLFGGLFELLFGVIEGGPISWCGCLFVLLGCGLCGGIALAIFSVASTCDSPNAVNFCRLF